MESTYDDLPTILERWSAVAELLADDSQRLTPILRHGLQECSQALQAEYCAVLASLKLVSVDGNQIYPTLAPTDGRYMV